MQPLVDGRHNLATLCFMHNTTGTSLEVNCIDLPAPFALLKLSYTMPSTTWGASFKLLLLEHKYLQATSYPCHGNASLNDWDISLLSPVHAFGEDHIVADISDPVHCRFICYQRSSSPTLEPTARRSTVETKIIIVDVGMHWRLQYHFKTKSWVFAIGNLISLTRPCASPVVSCSCYLRHNASSSFRNSRPSTSSSPLSTHPSGSIVSPSSNTSRGYAPRSRTISKPSKIWSPPKQTPCHCGQFSA